MNQSPACPCARIGNEAYLLGPIPSAYIVGRGLGGAAIRWMGDGNVAAHTLYRRLGPGTGVVVAAADIATGTIAVLVARLTGADQRLWFEMSVQAS